MAELLCGRRQGAISIRHEMPVWDHCFWSSFVLSMVRMADNLMVDPSLPGCLS